MEPAFLICLIMEYFLKSIGESPTTQIEATWGKAGAKFHLHLYLRCTVQGLAHNELQASAGQGNVWKWLIKQHTLNPFLHHCC